VEKYAKTDSSVLLEGPTGAGKELFAHALHALSRRSNGPFVSINCAAIPHELLESELFGYAPGAFSGAQKKGKMGKIELADKGTLFLDEIGDLPLSAQAKILRILEDHLVYKLGSNHPAKVTFRLVAATNRRLKTMIAEKKFRQDLYYRLNTMIIQIPPLTERTEDIPCLIHHFLGMYDKSHVSFSPKAKAALVRYNWPGNVRELKSAVECALSLIGPDSCTIDVADLPADIVSPSSSVPFDRVNICKPRVSTLVDSERRLIRTSLTENNWNMAKTARQLGISRAALYEKTKKFKLFRPKA
jgi:transcriptional regulator with PAS, ATPase and Fis domain